MNYQVRRAKSSDQITIMAFIKKHWQAEHILALDADFFRYFYGSDGDELNFFLVFDKDSGEILALEGFLPYLSSDREKKDICLSLWKSASSSHSVGMLPLKAIIEMAKNENGQIFCVGINAKTAAVYKFLGFHTGTMDHFYRLQNKKNYSVACIKNKVIPIVSPSSAILLPFNSPSLFATCFSQNALSKVRPYKTWDYLCHRYFDHPIYDYKIYGIQQDQSPIVESAIIAREIRQNGTKILRIVDILGDIDAIAHVAYALDTLLQKENYEYIDCYCAGVKSTIMKKAGFVKRTADDPNIIPNYFEPFIQQNISIHYTCTDMTNFRIFKGDGDQDRPNQILKKEEDQIQ